MLSLYLKFYTKTLKFDLINKFHYINLKKLPKLKKVILNFSCKTTDINILVKHLLVIELITNQKGVLTLSKHPILSLQIKKGEPTGCKLTLRKTNMLNFLSKSVNKIYPEIIGLTVTKCGI